VILTRKTKRTYVINVSAIGATSNQELYHNIETMIELPNFEEQF